ncbi:MAG: tetraacyldisaccharide 4'-kinase [Candidatus Tokpelaia sp. JSC189]|nr:MAG: tetraacyldisaccharide 4'-kinase [Candidatus Tokpelaia sp. JSC189]
MASKTPRFWWEAPGFSSHLLMPAAWIYSFFSRCNMENRIPEKIDLPVLCIGNFTLGGTGKTPVTIAFAQAAEKMGLKPGIVSRGYGGSVQSQHIVNIQYDRARDVGDESLLLAKHARVVVSKNRYAASLALQETGCDIILMDDGFQSRCLYPDYALIIVDATRNFGNGKIFPAGPLRAPVLTQLAYTDGILIIGEGESDGCTVRCAARLAKKPVYHAILKPHADRQVYGREFLAFAGIGNPHKFFLSIKEMGGVVKQHRIFADHYFFNGYDIRDIVESAKAHKLSLATTAKDYVRLKTGRQDSKLEDLTVFDVDVMFEKTDLCQIILSKTIKRYKKRHLA